MLHRQKMLIQMACLGLLFISTFSLAAEIQMGNNQPLADISWQDSEDKTHSVSDTNGKPRILHFWAAWCIPCREEMPKMLDWKKDNSDIVVIPLSMDQRMAQAKFFIKKLKLEMPPLLVNKKDRKKIEVPVLPYTIFIAKDGTQLATIKGIASWEDAQFSQQVRQLFK
ncbi:MAG: TlpA family protein disulfide reductase [Gammaproteobacteria bacterium]|nr:TlpA family protein disulfide reductase [Gammaproteobacteria bacterium]MBT6455346.1 TlpA family protein disulfide reductase [Gammaproteobacteria bacterium]MBT6701744.1 TlpA family protein disulfide reductase [Gammaproteobacteria bacterium]MBT7045689.1 TlpA family protein disulfide reductase [Gammaproteobacteria bacterium]